METVSIGSRCSFLNFFSLYIRVWLKRNNEFVSCCIVIMYKLFWKVVVFVTFVVFVYFTRNTMNCSFYDLSTFVLNISKFCALNIVNFILKYSFSSKRFVINPYWSGFPEHQQFNSRTPTVPNYDMKVSSLWNSCNKKTLTKLTLALLALRQLVISHLIPLLHIS